MAMRFSAPRLKNSTLQYVNLRAHLKLQDMMISQQQQSITILEDALKKNVKPMEITKPSVLNEARYMFSKMIYEGATANITVEEVRQMWKKSIKKDIRIDVLSSKIEELHEQLTKKLNETVLLEPLRPPYKDVSLAYEETVVREMNECNKMYESLIMDLPGLNITNASDASVDFVMERFFKLPEDVIRRVLDEWVAFKRDLHLAMEKFDFTLYLLDNNFDLISKDDYEGLTNVVRSDGEMLDKNDRKEAVSEMLQKWKYFKPKGASKKKVKLFKERIQYEKESRYEQRMRVWNREAFSKKIYGSDSITGQNTFELLFEVLNEEPSIGPGPIHSLDSAHPQRAAGHSVTATPSTQDVREE